MYTSPPAMMVEVWWRLAGTVPHKRWASDPDPVFPFPVLWDAWLTWRQLVNVVAHGSLPTELVAKRLGVTGATLLMVLAHAQLSSRSAQRVRSYAELVAKRLGVTGATLLMVLAHAQLSSRSAQRVRSYAGMAQWACRLQAD
ncbi:hypothetical protein HaLaN_02040 [Haematococcus lacustris]|uniref:Uncharacterized protein n=1 Tax=Haematococcus lacustris TaxID=44745 RepID=A0A699YAR8_HAELA|nr:hypothetical protein HaLaN_02040 [Haematococcus lacustris]